MDISQAFFESAVGIVLAGVVGYGLGRIRKHDTKKLLANGQSSKAVVTIDSTFYRTSQDTNLITRQKFVDQDIRTWREEIALEDIIPKEFEEHIAECLRAARQYCTEENPLVMMHLQKVVDQQEYSSILDVLKRHITGTVSSLFTHPESYFTNSDGQRPKEFKIFPVLVAEPYVAENKYRLILLTKNQLNPNSFPDIKNTRFPDSIGFEDWHTCNPMHRHAKRLRLHTNIARVLSDPNNEWMITDQLVRGTIHSPYGTAVPAAP